MEIYLKINVFLSKLPLHRVNYLVLKKNQPGPESNYFPLPTSYSFQQF